MGEQTSFCELLTWVLHQRLCWALSRVHGAFTPDVRGAPMPGGLAQTGCAALLPPWGQAVLLSGVFIFKDQMCFIPKCPDVFMLQARGPQHMCSTPGPWSCMSAGGWSALGVYVGRGPLAPLPHRGSLCENSIPHACITIELAPLTIVLSVSGKFHVKAFYKTRLNCF